MGEKKPKGTVKFCPLSPCKGNKTPIFQLHRHLQTSIPGLRPNTPSYIKASSTAPRVPLKQLELHVKNENEKNKRAKYKRIQQQERSSDEGSQDTDKKGVTQEKSKQMKEQRKLKREQKSSDHGVPKLKEIKQCNGRKWRVNEQEL